MSNEERKCLKGDNLGGLSHVLIRFLAFTQFVARIVNFNAFITYPFPSMPSSTARNLSSIHLYQPYHRPLETINFNLPVKQRRCYWVIKQAFETAKCSLNKSKRSAQLLENLQTRFFVQLMLSFSEKIKILFLRLLQSTIITFSSGSK